MAQEQIMSRLKAVKPENMNEEQLKYYNEIMARPVFKNLPENSPLVGPYNAWVRSPELTKVITPFSEYVRSQGILEKRLVELAIITVGRVWSSEFEFAAHAPVAVKAGISEDIVEAIRNKQEPLFDKADEEAVFHFAGELTSNNEISSQTYQAAIDRIGEQGVVELIGLMGFYVMVCMTLNAFQVQLISGMEEPFPEK